MKLHKDRPPFPRSDLVELRGEAAEGISPHPDVEPKRVFPFSFSFFFLRGFQFFMLMEVEAWNSSVIWSGRSDEIDFDE